MDVTKITLDENELPKRWYNIAADLPTPLDPPLNPQTKEPVTPDGLSAIFPMSLIKQEMSTDRWIDIPDEVRDIYALWRPTPLYRTMRCRGTGEEKVLFFCGGGHGDFDLVAYDNYLNGRIVDPEEQTDAIRRSISKLPEV
jgi:predicted alternative tryptophan synthase beta-subunit